MSIKSLLSLCAVYILTSGLVLAQTAPAEIYIYTNGECGMLDETGNGTIRGDAIEISTNSANGNVTLICSIKLDREVELRRTKIWNYENTLDNPINYGLCYTDFGPTDDWHEVITPSGNAKMTCHLK